MSKSYKKNNGTSGISIIITPIGYGHTTAGEQWQYLRLINQLTRTPVIRILAETSVGDKENYQFIDHNQIKLILSSNDVQVYGVGIEIGKTQIQYPMSDFYLNIRVINQQNQVTYETNTIAKEGGSTFIRFDRK